MTCLLLLRADSHGACAFCAVEELKHLQQALNQAQHEQHRYEAEVHRVRQEKNMIELEAAEKADEAEELTLKLEHVHSANSALQREAEQVSLGESDNKTIYTHR